MNYVDFFYSNYASVDVLINEDLKRQTRATIEYLLDNHLNSKEILNVLMNCAGKAVLSKFDLPDSLWKNSLIKRDKYYYHHILQIIPEVGEFFVEIKIKFTLNDLLKYFIKNLNINTSIINEKQYLAQLNSLINRYSALKFIEPLDFVLALIDNAVRKNYVILEPFDLNSSNNVSETLELLKIKVAEATARNTATEIFRKVKS